MWYATTRWIDKETHSIEEAANLFRAPENDFLSPNTGGITYRNLQKEMKFESTQKIKFDEREILYNVFIFSVDSIAPGEGSVESRTQTINGLIVLYQESGEVNYIINRNSDALKILRKLLGYDKRNEIIENKLGFNNDIFLWLIKKVFYEDSTFTFTTVSQTEKELSVNSIIGIRGETSDENKLSAQGSTVLNLISTLSFILESDLLKQLILRMEYTDHENTEVRINNKGVVSVDISSYSGNYESFEKYRLEACLLLLVYIDVLPKLSLSYYSEIEDDKWGFNKKEEFFTLIQDNLIKRLTERRQEFSEQITLFEDTAN